MLPPATVLVLARPTRPLTESTAQLEAPQDPVLIILHPTTNLWLSPGEKPLELPLNFVLPCKAGIGACVKLAPSLELDFYPPLFMPCLPCKKAQQPSCQHSEFFPCPNFTDCLKAHSCGTCQLETPNLANLSKRALMSAATPPLKPRHAVASADPWPFAS